MPPFVKIPGQENGHSENRQRPAPKHQKPEPYEDGCSGAYGYSPHEKHERQSSYNPKESRGRPDGGNTLNGYTHHGIHQPRSETAARPVPEKTEEQGENNRSLLSGLNLPFLDIFKKDSDMTLIIGLLMILISEKADKKLLFALIYILM